MLFSLQVLCRDPVLKILTSCAILRMEDAGGLGSSSAGIGLVPNVTENDVSMLEFCCLEKVNRPRYVAWNLLLRWDERLLQLQDSQFAFWFGAWTIPQLLAVDMRGRVPVSPTVDTEALGRCQSQLLPFEVFEKLTFRRCSVPIFVDIISPRIKKRGYSTFHGLILYYYSYNYAWHSE